MLQCHTHHRLASTQLHGSHRCFFAVDCLQLDATLKKMAADDAASQKSIRELKEKARLSSVSHASPPPLLCGVLTT